MKKLFNKLKNAALWLWQAPQNIVGLITYKCYNGYEICTKEVCGDNIRCKLSISIPGGITLGQYIILNNIQYLSHELGHTKQSKILGPSYLLIIGLPSIVHAGWCRLKGNKNNYYDFYTEHWLFPKENLQNYQK